MGKKLRLSHGVPTHIITNKKKFHGGPPTPTFFTTPPLPSPQPSYLSFLNIWGLSIIFLYCHILLLMCLNCNYELILFSIKGLFRILMLERQWYYLRSFLYTLIKKKLYIIFYRKRVTLLFDLRKILVTPFYKIIISNTFNN